MSAKITIKSRLAVADDFQAFYGKPPPRAVRARVLEQGGRVVGVAGYHIVDGVAVMFSDMSEPIPPITIWRESKAFMASMKIPATCIAESYSGPFLERLGWVHAGHSADGEVYTWQPCS